VHPVRTSFLSTVCVDAPSPQGAIVPARPTRTLAALAAVVLPLGLLAGAGTPAYAAPVPLSPCVDPDNTRPVVTAVTLSKATVDTTAGTDAVDVTVAESDAGGPGAASGVASVRMTLVGPPGGFATEGLVRMTDAGGGSWTVHLVLPRGLAPGEYRPQLTVVDRAGNYRSYGSGADAVPGDPALHVASVADRAAPALASLRLSTTSLSTRRTAKNLVVRVHATDARAGVKRIAVAAAADSRRVATARLRLVSGTANDGRWRGTLRIPRYMGDATWRLVSVGLADRLVNVRNLSAGDLRRLAGRRHVDRSFRVRSRSDAARPTARPATFSVPAVDVTAADQQVVVRVRASDDAAGVAALRLRLLDPGSSDGGFDTAMTRVSGTVRDGVWQSVVTITQCGTVGGTWTAQLKLTDAAGRSRQYLSGQPTLAVTARDNLVPQVVRTYVSGAPVLSFSEDVTGITATSATVYDDAGNDVAGAWSCTDVTGAVAACSVGSVRTATFTPVPSFAATGPLYVELNPDGSLGVTDLAGNPVGRRYIL
jgi:hypothetical protein